MFDKFLKFIETNKLFDKSSKILAAVSGGADSVALVKLLYEAEFNFAIAHCNFKIRGKEADRDHEFVKKLSKKYNIYFFDKICPAVEYAKNKGISIEMAARELRYDFFQSVVKKYNFDVIATAHNADDSIETFLLNLSRKTGIKGLMGIPVKQNNIVRPLLFASKKQIYEFCEKNNLQFVEDSTNFETKYFRNKIRHLIIPAFENINPAFKENVLATIENLKDYYKVFKYHYENFVRQCTQKNTDYISVNIECLKKYGFYVFCTNS